MEELFVVVVSVVSAIVTVVAVGAVTVVTIPVVVPATASNLSDGPTVPLGSAEVCGVESSGC